MKENKPMKKKWSVDKFLGLFLVLMSTAFVIAALFASSQMDTIGKLEKTLAEKELQLTNTQEKARDLEVLVQKFQMDIGAMGEQAAKDQEIIRVLGEKIDTYVSAIRKISTRWITFEGNFCDDDIVPVTQKWMRKMGGK